MPVGKAEGSTEVDIVIETDTLLCFIEAKHHAEASAATTHDVERDQLTRNLDVGFALSRQGNKDFQLVYLTADDAEPFLVRAVRQKSTGFDLTPGASVEDITSRLHWTNWASVGAIVARAYKDNCFSGTERCFALDLLAYLAKRKLWTNTLADEEAFYTDPLLGALTTHRSEYERKHKRRPERDTRWTLQPWSEDELRTFLLELSDEREKALLKLIATYGGAVRQSTILAALPFIAGSNGLQRLKSNINAHCRDRYRARILPWGTGHGDDRVHALNPALGKLRHVMIDVASAYKIRTHLL